MLCIHVMAMLGSLMMSPPVVRTRVWLSSCKWCFEHTALVASSTHMMHMQHVVCARCPTAAIECCLIHGFELFLHV